MPIAHRSAEAARSEMPLTTALRLGACRQPSSRIGFTSGKAVPKATPVRCVADPAGMTKIPEPLDVVRAVVEPKLRRRAQNIGWLARKWLTTQLVKLAALA